MITVPGGVRIHLALGATDMRKGFDELSLLVQEVLRADPFSGHLFVFRRRRAGSVSTRARQPTVPHRSLLGHAFCMIPSATRAPLAKRKRWWEAGTT